MLQDKFQILVTIKISFIKILHALHTIKENWGSGVCKLLPPLTNNERLKFQLNKISLSPSTSATDNNKQSNIGPYFILL